MNKIENLFSEIENLGMNKVKTLSTDVILNFEKGNDSNILNEFNELRIDELILMDKENFINKESFICYANIVDGLDPITVNSLKINEHTKTQFVTYNLVEDSKFSLTEKILLPKIHNHKSYSVDKVDNENWVLSYAYVYKNKLKVNIGAINPSKPIQKTIGNNPEIKSLINNCFNVYKDKVEEAIIDINGKINNFNSTFVKKIETEILNRQTILNKEKNDLENKISDLIK